jgi:hypothetical protein
MTVSSLGLNAGFATQFGQRMPSTVKSLNRSETPTISYLKVYR